MDKLHTPLLCLSTIKYLVPAWLLSVLLACSQQTPSVVAEDLYLSGDNDDANWQTTQEIGHALGISDPRPALKTNGEHQFKILAGGPEYADAGVLIQLQASVQRTTATAIARTLWRQVSGPEVSFTAPHRLDTEVVLPDVAEVDTVVLTLMVGDEQGYVAQRLVTVTVLPVEEAVVNTAVVRSQGQGIITFEVALQGDIGDSFDLTYTTVDGTALAGQDYVEQQGVVTLGAEEQSARIDVSVLSAEAQERKYFIFQLSSADPAIYLRRVYAVIKDTDIGGATKPQLPIDSSSSSASSSSGGTSASSSSSSTSSSSSSSSGALTTPCVSGQATEQLPSCSSLQTQGNPFADAHLYVDPDYVACVESSQAQLEVGSDLYSAMEVVKQQPTAIWLDGVRMLHEGDPATQRRSLKAHFDEATRRQQALAENGDIPPMVVQVVLFNSPARGSLDEAGFEAGFTEAGLQAYQEDFVGGFVALVEQYPNLRVSAVIEPNSRVRITDRGCITHKEKCWLLAGLLRDAIVRLSEVATGNIYSYLDAGHTSWKMPPSQILEFLSGTETSSVDLLAPSYLRGFAVNVASYTPTHEPLIIDSFSLNPTEFSAYHANPAFDDAGYMRILREGLPEAVRDDFGFIVDSSRNGWGGVGRPTLEGGDGSRIDKRLVSRSWCNIKTAGMGVSPTALPDETMPFVDAYTWTKQPGVSDGYYVEGEPLYPDRLPNDQCGPDNPDAYPEAPPAGHWFHNAFVSLIENAWPQFIQTDSPVTAPLTDLGFVVKSGILTAVDDIVLAGEIAPGGVIQGIEVMVNGVELPLGDGEIEVAQNSFTINISALPLQSVQREFMDKGSRPADDSHLEIQVRVTDLTNMVSAGTVVATSAVFSAGTLGNDFMIVPPLPYDPLSMLPPPLRARVFLLGGDDVVVSGGRPAPEIHLGEGDDIIVFEPDRIPANRVYGGSGGDTYAILGDSWQPFIIYEEANDIVGVDRIQFSDIDPQDVVLNQARNNLMILGVGANQDVIEIIDYFTPEGAFNNSIERIEFADGTVWEYSDVVAILSGT